MTKKMKKWLLSELLDLFLCVAIAATMGYWMNSKIRHQVRQHINNTIRTEWVKAARELEHSQDISLGYDETKL